MSVTVYYQGVLAEVTGVSSESVEGSGSRGHILEILLERHPGLKKLNFVFSLNETVTHTDAIINTGDQISLIPPPPGG